jgi:peroxiredoxin
MRHGFECLVLVALITAPVRAQDDLLEGHSGHGETFNEGPRQSAFLMEGTGNVHFPITVATEELQRLFDQGVGQLHGFWYFEAERTFRQIASGDPDCAMAYWGMAMANIDNPERATGFARVAWLKRGLADEREQMYIDALAKFHLAGDPEEDEDEEESEESEEGTADESTEEAVEETADDCEEPLLTVEEKKAGAKKDKEERAEQRERAQQLVVDYEEIIWEYPDDIEAKAFLVNRLWINGYMGLDISSRHANEALLQQIFAVEPMHPAHHYRIHLWDEEETAGRVVDSAAKLGHCAPTIAHMWHMGGHIFEQLGRHTDASWQQEASARVDHANMMRDWVLPDQIHNFAHNNEWLTRSMRHHGRVREAVDLAKNMIELPRHPIYNTLDQRGSASYGRRRLLETLELFEQWDELIALADTMYLEPSDGATDGALRAFVLGKAYAHLGDDEGFEAQVIALEAMRANSRGKRAEALDETEDRALAADFESDDLRAVLDEVLDEYTRELDDVHDKLDALHALRALLNGEDAEENIEVLEESHFNKSQLARLCLEAEGDFDEKAVEIAREAIEDKKGQLYPHATLAETLYATGGEEEALEIFDDLREWTARADLDLPIFRRLAPLAEARELPSNWRVADVTAEDVGERLDLGTLGPLRWTPPEALDWTCSDAFGNEIALADYTGRPVIVIFFLGFGCVHCVEQLVEFAPAYDQFLEADIEIVTIGTDSAEKLRDSFGDDPSDTGYPFPVLADADMKHFRRYRAYDDFEDMPLHGTFLVDGDGRVRWQDVSYEPFMDWEFLLEESQRLLGLDAPLRRASSSSGGSGAGR